MAHEIDLGGTIYISSKRAAEITGYAQDYIGQLARSGAIEAKRISGLWYILEESLRNHKKTAEEFKPVPPQRTRAPAEMEAAVSFDGRDFISAQRASKITGYHQDYVTQLARSGKILSRQIGNRWYVDREGLVEHKKHADDLLGAVQAQAVGIERPAPPEAEVLSSDSDLHFKYEEHSSVDETPAYAKIQEKEPVAISVEGSPMQNDQQAPSIPEVVVEEEEYAIPIRVIEERVAEIQPKTAEMPRKKQKRRSIGPRLAIFSAIFIISGGLVYLGLSLARVPVPQLPGIDQLAITTPGEGSSVVTRIRNIFSKELIYIRN